jgi:uncharacterized protein (UPF0264 family)
MSKLLVSVRNEQEARAAVAGGADWIDLKEPWLGSLGAIDLATAQRASECVPLEMPLSAALGELTDWPGHAAQQLLGVGRIRYVKLGLAGCASTSWRAKWLAVKHQAARGSAQLIAVAYGDAANAAAPEPEEVLAHAIGSAASWLLIDTFDKTRGTIIDVLGRTRLDRLIAGARTNGMRVATAGGLRLADFDRLPIEAIDLIAVRGAACHSGRESGVEERCVRQLRQALHASTLK